MKKENKIDYNSRYHKPLQILTSLISANNLFKLVYNDDKESYSFPYLYKNYKNELEPIKMSSKILDSIKSFFDQNLFNADEKQLLIQSIINDIEMFGSSIIESLEHRNKYLIENNANHQLVIEYEKTIKALTDIRQILVSEIQNLYISSVINDKSLMKSKEQLIDIILHEFRKRNCRANHIIMWRYFHNSLIPKLNPKEQDLFYVALNEVIKDGYIKYEDASTGPECLRLTEKGFDKIYDDNPKTIEKNEDHNLPTVVILTAILEEYNAVRTHLENIEEVTINDTEYESGIFTFDGKEIAKVLVRECGAKNSIASQETERAISNFKPDCLLFVGIAGSRKPNDFLIGDVIFPEKIYSYEGGKSAKDAFKARPDLANCDYTLSEIAKKERRKDDWKQLIKGKYNREVSANLGVIASGEKLVEHFDSEIGDVLTKHFNDTSAVEMEGFGFAKAAARQGRDTNKVVIGVVRGISDILEQPDKTDAINSTDDRRPANAKKIASDTAAAFALWLINKLYNK